MTALILYGIPNCDTIKKARAWLEAAGVAYRFHDYRKDGVDRAALERWVYAKGWETLLNRAGTTFRKLPPEAREGIDREGAIALMLAQPAMIKRPVAESDGRLLVGFKPDLYAEAFQ